MTESPSAVDRLNPANLTDLQLISALTHFISISKLFASPALFAHSEHLAETMEPEPELAQFYIAVAMLLAEERDIRIKLHTATAELMKDLDNGDFNE